MQRIFEVFAERLSESVDERDLRNAMATAAGALELPAFAYMSLELNSGNRPRLISNYPSRWTSYYLRRGYEKIDPVILRARCGECPFHWGPDCCHVNLSPAQQELFDEATQFGIACGLTIPIHDRRGGTAAMSFATGERNPTFLRVAERYKQALQLMATCFHIQARKKLSGERRVDGVILTPREFECLQWAARGKSAWEIGCILGITRRTAAFHLDNARKKLGVRTITQAVARLASSGHPIH